MGSGASKPASAAHGFKGPAAVNETSETGSVASELPSDDAPPGTLLTTEPSQATADRDTTDGLSDTDSETSECTSTEDSDVDRTPCEEGEDVLPQLTEEETREKLDKLLDTFEKLYQDTCDQLKQQLVSWQDVFMDTTNSMVEKLIQLLNSVYSSYFQIKDDNQIQHKYRMDYKRKAGKRLVKVELVHVLCDGVVKCLEVIKCDEDNGNVLEYRSLLYLMLSILWNFTDDNPIVCDAIRMHERLLKTLVIRLDDTCTRYNNPSLQTGDDPIDLPCVNILHNFGLEEKNVPHLRQIPNIVDVLSRFIHLDERLTVRKFCAILTLASVVTDAEADKLTTTSDMIKVLLSCVRVALSNNEHRVIIETTTANLKELLKAVKRLSRNTSNSRLLVKERALPLLTQGLQDCKHQAERKACMESLWWLSFNAENQEDMMKDTELLDLVIKVYRDDSDPCHSAAAGMLFQLREHLQKHYRKDYNDVANQLLRTSGSKPRHAMLSYSSDNRAKVKQIHDFLRDNGISVWMDIYKMAEGEASTTQTMAEAVQGSVVFLMCVSESYKRSQYCRQEAEYANKRRKCIVPLKLQKGYEADGWLGFIMGNDYFYDFTKEKPDLKDVEDKLLRKVKKQFTVMSEEHTDGPGDESHGGIVAYSAPKTASVSDSETERMRNWKRENVEEWLSKFELRGKKVQLLTGLQIAFLRQLKSEAPEFFYQLLKSDLQLKTVEDMAKFIYALDML